MLTTALPRRRLLSLAGLLGLGGCTGLARQPWPASPPGPVDGEFTMADGVRLPYRAWLPDEPWAVALALHGFNDSRDAWEVSAPVFNAGGVALFAPDQRGFGDAPRRGRWAGSLDLVDDAAVMLAAVHRRLPRARLFVMGESMGGAVALALAARRDVPDLAGAVLASPAVWGRAEMGIVLQAVLWLAVHTVPGLALSNGPVRVIASDNRAALIRLSSDPLTIHETRVDTLRGLVNLMGDALDAARTLHRPALLMYGGHDQLVPAHAMAAAWRSLVAEGAADPADPPHGLARLAYYPDGYHLLLRDRDRAAPLGDALSWMRSPGAWLPSGADRAAATWLAAQPA